MKTPDFTYVAYADCGCLVGIGADFADEDTADWVAEIISSGGSVVRMPTEEAKKVLREKGFGCKCSRKQEVVDVEG